MKFKTLSTCILILGMTSLFACGVKRAPSPIYSTPLPFAEDYSRGASPPSPSADASATPSVTPDSNGKNTQ